MLTCDLPTYFAYDLEQDTWSDSIDASIAQNMTARKLHKSVASFVTRQCSLQTSKRMRPYLSLLDSRRILSMFHWLYRVSLKRDRSSSMQRLLPMKSKLGMCAELQMSLQNCSPVCWTQQWPWDSAEVQMQSLTRFSWALAAGPNFAPPIYIHLHHAWDNELPVKPIHLRFSKASYTRGQ